jgi:hypothetical protein
MKKNHCYFQCCTFLSIEYNTDTIVLVGNVFAKMHPASVYAVSNMSPAASNISPAVNQGVGDDSPQQISICMAIQDLQQELAH